MRTTTKKALKPSIHSQNWRKIGEERAAESAVYSNLLSSIYYLLLSSIRFLVASDLKEFGVSRPLAASELPGTSNEHQAPCLAFFGFRHARRIPSNRPMRSPVASELTMTHSAIDIEPISQRE
jgi:hypothetical protein